MTLNIDLIHAIEAQRIIGTLETDVIATAAKAIGMRTDNASRSLARMAEAGTLTPDTYTLTLDGFTTLSNSKTIVALPIGLVSPSDFNPRKTFDEDQIAELAASIKANGQLQNIGVRRITDQDRTSPTDPPYKIVFGERRWRAICRLAERDGMDATTSTIMAQILNIDEATHLEMAIEENRARQDVHPLEQAEAFARLKVLRDGQADQGDVTQKIAERMGVSRRNVQFYIRCATDLSPKAKAAWRSGQIPTFKMACELARWPHDKQDDALELIGNSDVWDTIETLDELRDWMTRESLTSKKLHPDVLRLYVEAGGRIGSMETHDQKDDDGTGDTQAPIHDLGLATRLTHEYCARELTKITANERYETPPAISDKDWRASYFELRPNELDQYPAELRLAIASVSAEYLTPIFIHPVINRAHYHAWIAAQKEQDTQPEGNTATQPSAPPSQDPITFSKRVFIKGARMRTEHLQHQIAQNPHTAMTVAIVAILSRGSTPLARIACRFLSGDEHQTQSETSAAAQFLRNLKSDDGFADGEIIDAHAATNTLLNANVNDVQDLFASVIADHVNDGSYTTTAGTRHGESIALVDWFGKPIDPAMCHTAEHFALYTREEIDRIAHVSGADAAREARGEAMAAKKTDRIEQVLQDLPADWTAIESQFLTPADARQAIAALNTDAVTP